MNWPVVTQIYSSSEKRVLGTNRFQRHRITLTDLDFPWRLEVTQRLEDLIRLDIGWDGYGGLPVTLENAVFTLNVLGATCKGDIPAPQIVPGPTGEVQIEWHTEFGDVELLVRGPNNVHAWRSYGEIENEAELTTDFLQISHWVNEVMEPNIALSAAA